MKLVLIVFYFQFSSKFRIGLNKRLKSIINLRFISIELKILSKICNYLKLELQNPSEFGKLIKSNYEFYEN